MSGDLDTLLSDGLIDEVLGRLKTGKEAEVWLVRHGDEVLAAKIYKERHVRSFKNNAGYKEGRQVRNSRTQRAIARGSKFGRESEEDAWKSAEADALYKLRAQGVRVPEPKAFYDGVLLMQLVVDGEGQPAPRLIDAHLTPEEAAAAYADLRSQVVAMLCAELIHGDLSPYNVLLGAAGPTIIDLPQVVGAAHNNLAESFFRRDLENLRLHFAGIDPSLSARASDAAEIWAAYVRRELTPDFVPTGRAPPAPDRQRGGDHDRRRRGGRPQSPPVQGQGRGPGPQRQELRIAHGPAPGQPRHAGQGHASHPHPPRGAQQQGKQQPGQEQPRPPRHGRAPQGQPQQNHAQRGHTQQRHPQRGQPQQQRHAHTQHGRPGPSGPRAGPPAAPVRGGPQHARHGARPPPRAGPPPPVVERVQRTAAPFAQKPPKPPEPRASEGEARPQPRPAEEKPPAPRREE